MPRGGKRLGAGRKADPIEGKRRQRWFMLTAPEFAKVKDFIEHMRQQKAEAKSNATND